MKCSVLLALALVPLVVIDSAHAAKKPAYVYGPTPDWEIYKAMGAKAALAKMPDPEHWSVEWPNAHVQGGWRHKGRFDGYMTCGVLRATGPVQDKRQLINFAVVIDRGEVKTVDISQKASNSLVNIICRELVARGHLPPASFMTRDQAVSIAKLALTVRPMPDGAYVTEAGATSPEAITGITAGMVITKVNGIALAGMGGAMIKLLESDAATLTFELATGDTIQLRGPK